MKYMLIAWERRQRGAWAEKFHSTVEVRRQILGAALPQGWDWAISGWTRSLAPHAYSTTPRNGNRVNGNHLEICLSFPQKKKLTYLGPGGLDSVFCLPCTV